MYTIEAGRLMSPSTTSYNSFHSPKVYLTEKGKETKRTLEDVVFSSPLQ